MVGKEAGSIISSIATFTITETVAPLCVILSAGGTGGVVFYLTSCLNEYAYLLFKLPEEAPSG